MKAVILETRKNKAVALSDDGAVKEVLNRNYKIGQTIEMERKTMTKMSKKYRNIAAGIAASLVILLGAGTTYAYNTPVAHVSLDVNPSVTYSVNAFNRVIDIDAANSDADAILDKIEWDGKKIDKVVKETISALKEANYLESEEWYLDSLIIGVNATSTDKEDQLVLVIKEEIAEMVEEETGEDINTAKLKNNVTGIGADRVAAAKEYKFDVTPGKLNLVQKLDASYDKLGKGLNTTPQSVWLKGSVKEIMAQIKANRLALKDKTVEEADAVSTDDESEIKDNSNNGISNGEGNVKANDDAGLNNRDGEMEQQRNENANANANQNGLSRGAIESKDN